MEGGARTAHTLRAGWTRLALGLVALGPGVLLLPELARHRWLFAAYVASSLLMQLLIWKQIGGELRALVGGLVDIAVLTYLVHRLGSVSSLLISLYVVLGIMMALVHQRRVAYGLAVTGTLSYGTVLLCEATGVLPYSPDGSRFAAPAPPDVPVAIMSTLLVGVLLGIATTTVSRLLGAINEREQELMKVNRQLEELSQRDPLTQLYNRRFLFACLERELARARRGHALSLLMVDLDGFKQVNDRHGHLAGDELLQAISRGIEGSIRISDVAGRYGGDEFAVVLPDTDTEQAERVATRLAEAIRDASVNGVPGVTASIGVAVARSGDDARSVQRRADDASYRAKQAGGDRVAI